MMNHYRPTLIERFIQLIPLRYPLAVLVWTIILDPVGFSLVNYLQTGASPLSLPSPVNAFFGLVLSLYLFYIVRYLRLHVVDAEPKITPIMPGGEGEYHSVFGGLNNYLPVILLTLLLEVLTGPATNFSDYVGITPLHVYDQFTRILVLLSFSTLVWEYSVSSWGLHRLGRSDLRLKSFLEDRFMGARAIGNVALSLTTAYLAGLLLFFLDSATFIPLSAAVEGFFLILLVLGVVLFFLPLNSLHEKMQAKKAEFQQALSKRFLTVENLSNALSSDDPVQPGAAETGVKELVLLKNLEITERRLANTATWPFDAQLLAKLITIIVSITAVLLSRIITDLLHI